MKKRLAILILTLALMPALGFAAGETPVAAFPSDGAYIRDWLICGPFPNAPGANPIDFKHDRRCAGYYKDLLISMGGEKNASPKEGDSFVDAETGNAFSWQRIQAETDLIPFDTLFKPNDLVVAYGFCLINSASETSAILSLGSNDGVRVFLNGSLVHDFLIGRWLGKDTDYVPIHLVKGENRLLIKVEEGTGDWGFSARLLNHKETIDSIEKNLPQYTKLTVAMLDDEIVATFGQPYQIGTLNPGALSQIEARDSQDQLKALLASPPGMEVKFPAWGFPDGPLTFRAFLTLPDGRMITSERQYFKGNLPRHKMAEMVRPDLTVTRDGKPFFPIGCYGARPEDYKMLKEAGFNFVIAAPTELDKVLEAGLMAGIGFHGDDAAYLAGLRESIKKYKDHPAVLCWMLADEPELNRLDLMVIHRAYQEAHELDPKHPTYLVITDPRGYETFGRCCDVLAIDTYPISRGTIQDVGNNIAKGYRSTDGDLPIWHCGQTFQWPSDRVPNPVEHRYMSYLSILEGVKGMLWYAHRWGDFHLPEDAPELWEAHKSLIKELHQLEPFLLAEGFGQMLTISSDNKCARGMLKKDNAGNTLLVLLNSTRDSKAAAVIDLSGLKGMKFASLENGQEITIPEDGKLSLEFEPLQVRVFVSKP